MLEIKNLYAGYGEHTILSDVCAEFKKGCLTSIVGPNGCGKSTLLKSIIKVLPDQKGDIIIDGQSLDDMSRGDIAKKISYLSQGRSIPDMTVGETVLHGRFPYLRYPKRYTETDRAIAHRSMEQMGIADLADKHLSELSGGMLQTVYIAMALTQDTDYILLDEPTTYLDISHQLTLMRTLSDLAKSGKGIITVMHDLPLAFTFSDSVAVMKDRKISAVGSPDDIYCSEHIMNALGVSLKKEGSSYFYLF